MLKMSAVGGWTPATRKGHAIAALCCAPGGAKVGSNAVVAETDPIGVKPEELGGVGGYA